MSAKSRPATFAQQGWYDADPAALAARVLGFLGTPSNRADAVAHAAEAKAGLGAAPSSVMGVIAPHAGLRFGGPTAGVAYRALTSALVPASNASADEVDASTALRRVILMGPSHRSRFEGVGLSGFAAYSTPLGDLAVDLAGSDRLRAALDGRGSSSRKETPEQGGGVRGALSRVFGRGSQAGAACPHHTLANAVEVNEHSLELHTPFIAHALAARRRALPDAEPVQVIPLVVGNVSSSQEAALGAAIRDAFFSASPRDTLVCVSSDFCHWGERFGYQHMFAPTATSAAPTRFAAPAAASLSIAQRIELMDHEGMAACSSGDAARWAAYFDATGNTICGRRPIGAILRGFLGGGDVGDWLGATLGLFIAGALLCLVIPLLLLLGVALPLFIVAAVLGVGLVAVLGVGAVVGSPLILLGLLLFVVLRNRRRANAATSAPV